MANSLNNSKESFLKALVSLDENDKTFKKLTQKRKFYEFKLKILKKAEELKKIEFEGVSDFNLKTDTFFNDDRLIFEIVSLQNQLYENKLMQKELNLEAKNKIIDIQWITPKINQNDNSNINMIDFFLEKLKKDVTSRKITKKNEIYTEIKEKKKLLNKEMAEIDKKIDFEEEIQKFNEKIEKKQFFKEIWTLLDRIGNPNLIPLEEFEVSSCFKNEELILMNLGFLTQKKLFDNYLLTVGNESKNEKNLNLQQLYQKLIGILNKLQPLLLKNFDLENQNNNFIENNKLSDSPKKNPKNSKVCENLLIENSKNEENSENEENSQIEKKITKNICLKLLDFVGNTIKMCLDTLEMNEKEMNRVVLAKTENLKKHFEILRNQEIAGIDEYGQVSKDKILKNERKLENLGSEIKKIEEEKKEIEERLEKARKKYKGDYLKKINLK